MKQKANLGFYVQTINDIVKDTEEIGSNMHGSYEEVRTAIDEGKTAEFEINRLSEIHRLFSEGTDAYRLMLEKISKLRPPAKVLGIHKKLERSYMEYVAGCDEMVLSIADGNIDSKTFDAAEKKQDKATEDITFCIQKMTKMLLG